MRSPPKSEVAAWGRCGRATDTHLGRQVAIKILPDAFAQDPDRLARFEREAKTLASLNHPNIAIIHGLEKADGIRALVMELVEGPTLEDRIRRGAIPIGEALGIAKQIAEALEAAHERGIVHRDLKPGNVKVRADGAVKVLDFGIAKAMEPAAGSSPSVSMSPTITTPAMTRAGMILGTAAYMSPGAGGGSSGRSPCGRLGLRNRSLRNAHRHAGVRRQEHLSRHRPRPGARASGSFRVGVAVTLTSPRGVWS